MLSMMTETIIFFRPTEFSIKLHAIKSGWSSVYIEGSQVIISKKNSLKIDFVLANSTDPDEMPHYHVGLSHYTMPPLFAKVGLLI